MYMRPVLSAAGGHLGPGSVFAASWELINWVRNKALGLTCGDEDRHRGVL